MVSSKRILYVKNVVRLLRMSVSKYQDLLSKADGQKSFDAAVCNLMISINAFASKEDETSCINIMEEIIGSIQTQGEFTSMQFVRALISWQCSCDKGNILLASTLNAIGRCKTLTFNVFDLLESTISNYFRRTVEQEDHFPSWRDVMTRLGPRVTSLEVPQLIENNRLLCLHVHIITEVRKIQDSGDKITYLQTVFKQLENYRTK